MKKRRTETGAGDELRSGSSLTRSLKSIGWAFLGIRSRKTHDNETAHVSPLLLIVVAFAAVLVFVFGMMALVHWLASGVGGQGS